MRGGEGSDAPGADHRFDDRFTSTDSLSLLPVTADSAPVRATTDGALQGTTPPPADAGRVSARKDLSALNDDLGERDLTIVQSVYEHRFLTVRQIHALHFHELSPASGLRIAQRVLARLRRKRLLATLPRRVGGVRAGSRGLVHHVDANGERLLRRQSGKQVRRRFTTPSATFLRHTLAVADSHIELVLADRLRQMELVRAQIEPAAWRRYMGLGGAQITLKSDLYVESSPTFGSDYVDGWFVEVDLGTESIPTLLKKCREYEAYRRTGIEQDRGGFPLVVWSMTHRDLAIAERRRAAFADAIDTDRQLNPAMFRIVAPNQLIALMQKGGRR